MTIITNPTNKPASTANKSTIVGKSGLTQEELERLDKEVFGEFGEKLSAALEKGRLEDLKKLNDPPKKDDSENLKRLRIEKDNIVKKYTNLQQNTIKEFKESYNKLEEENRRLKGDKGDKGDNMEVKDEKEIENVIVKVLEKQNKNNKFESTIGDIHSKISKIDSIEGKLLDIIPKVSKIDSICEDGKCFRTELADIKKDLAETKKGQIKAEVCPECGEKSIMHSESFLSSHCANCGKDTEGWADDKGVPIVGWKPYKLRGK